MNNMVENRSLETEGGKEEIGTGDLSHMQQRRILELHIEV
jgi:hypothetical protein